MALTHARLKEVLTYDPETGIFRWTGKKVRTVEGKIAGNFSPRLGRRRVICDRRHYLSSRLAWFYMTGEWPAGDIDHKDCDPTNDRWMNLREATRQQNCCNTRPHRDSKTGIKGVTWHKASRKWRAKISIKGVYVHLGTYTDQGHARIAYERAARAANGEFARTA